MDRMMVLDGSWQLYLVDDAKVGSGICCMEDVPGESVEGQVPGDWVLDFVRAGFMPDPYFGENYLKIRDYECHHVFYGRTFLWNGSTKRVFIRFEGIDTVADVYLNGKQIGHAENMFIPHEFEALYLKEGENELFVHIRPLALEARRYPIAAFSTAAKYNYESLVIRKAAHTFGWDICPRICSAGLWRSVTVIQKQEQRIEDIFLWTDRIANGTAHCLAAFDIDIGRMPVKGCSLKIEGTCGDSSFEWEDDLWYVHGRVSFDIPDACLWWPRGYGKQNRYSITVTLFRNGRVLDQRQFRQGFRTAELVRDDMIDRDGNGDFCFVINGKRIYVKGTNWVPADAFHSNDTNRIPEILKLVKDIGCNALRVWGGGVYESDGFYEWCDENGMIVWQDFMMACGIYPHTERMQRQLAEEAAVEVRRLRRHESICLWAGDNECDQNYCWGVTKHDPTLNVLTRNVLPAVLMAEDLTRPYLPSSPYVSPESYAAGQVTNTTEQHLWGPRDYFKGHFYHDATAVFASEMGYHGCNSPASLYRFLGNENAWPVTGNDAYLYHAASPETGPHAPYTYRIPLMTKQLMFLFGQEPENLDEYARMSQISQAEAKKFFVESFRARKGKRTGLIWWNIMDCWPQISDAVVDYYFVRKLAYFFIRRSQRDVCLMLDDHSGSLELFGVNDCQEEEKVVFKVTDLDSGEIMASGEKVLAMDASTLLIEMPKAEGNHFYRIEWTQTDGRTYTNHYVKGVPPYDYEWYMKHLKEMRYDEFEGFGN